MAESGKISKGKIVGKMGKMGTMSISTSKTSIQAQPVQGNRVEEEEEVEPNMPLIMGSERKKVQLMVGDKTVGRKGKAISKVKSVSAMVLDGGLLEGNLGKDIGISAKQVQTKSVEAQEAKMGNSLASGNPTVVSKKNVSKGIDAIGSFGDQTLKKSWADQVEEEESEQSEKEESKEEEEAEEGSDASSNDLDFTDNELDLGGNNSGEYTEAPRKGSALRREISDVDLVMRISECEDDIEVLLVQQSFCSMDGDRDGISLIKRNLEPIKERLVILKELREIRLIRKRDLVLNVEKKEVKNI